MVAANKLRARIVPEVFRGLFLPSLVGRHHPNFEAYVHRWASRQCAQYTGARWQYVVLANGAGFMYPDLPHPLVDVVSLNGWSGRMSPQLFGLCLTLTAFSGLSIEAYRNGDAAESHEIGQRYIGLRDYLYSEYGDTEQVADVLAFLD